MRPAPPRVATQRPALFLSGQAASVTASGASPPPDETALWQPSQGTAACNSFTLDKGAAADRRGWLPPSLPPSRLRAQEEPGRGGCLPRGEAGPETPGGGGTGRKLPVAVGTGQGQASPLPLQGLKAPTRSAHCSQEGQSPASQALPARVMLARWLAGGPQKSGLGLRRRTLSHSGPTTAGGRLPTTTQTAPGRAGWTWHCSAKQPPPLLLAPGSQQPPCCFSHPAAPRLNIRTQHFNWGWRKSSGKPPHLRLKFRACWGRG